MLHYNHRLNEIKMLQTVSRTIFKFTKCCITTMTLFLSLAVVVLVQDKNQPMARANDIQIKSLRSDRWHLCNDSSNKI